MYINTTHTNFIGAIKADPVKTIPTKKSNVGAWIQWHKDLKSKYGKKVANSLWLKAWEKRGSNSVNTVALRDYLDKQGIKIGTSAWDDILDTGSGVTDYFGDMIKVGKYTGIALTVILVAGIGLLVFNIARKPGEAAQTALMLRGGGR